MRKSAAENWHWYWEIKEKLNNEWDTGFPPLSNDIDSAYFTNSANAVVEIELARI